MSASGAWEIHSFSPGVGTPPLRSRLGRERQCRRVRAGLRLGERKRATARPAATAGSTRPELLAPGLRIGYAPRPWVAERCLRLGARAGKRLADEAQLDRAGPLKQPRQQAVLGEGAQELPVDVAGVSGFGDRRQLSAASSWVRAYSERCSSVR